MFLKSAPFTFNDETITLYELSALQRIEYLKYLARDVVPEAEQEKESSVLQAELVEKSIRASAMLVAMSLWQNDTQGPSVEALNLVLLSSWPVTALGKADQQVKSLSGLIPEDQPPLESHEYQSEEPALSAEKS